MMPRKDFDTSTKRDETVVKREQGPAKSMVRKTMNEPDSSATSAQQRARGPETGGSAQRPDRAHGQQRGVATNTGSPDGEDFAVSAGKIREVIDCVKPCIKPSSGLRGDGK